MNICSGICLGLMCVAMGIILQMWVTNWGVVIGIAGCGLFWLWGLQSEVEEKELKSQ